MINRQGAYAFILALALLFTACHIPFHDASSLHNIIGVIYDLDNNTVMGAMVYINNTETNESMSFVSDELGRYSVNIDSNLGDILSITAIYYQLRANGSRLVTSEPFDQLDLVLDYHVHIIDGYILKPDGLPAIHYAVIVYNMDRNESRYVPSAIDGYYRMDIGAYINGWGVNEDIRVSVDFMDFNGSSLGTVSNNISDMINVTLIDNKSPAPNIREAPASVNINQNFRMLVWVTENHTVDSVTLFMKKSGEPLFTEINMIRDDGAANDWNGDNMATAPLFGQSTSRDIDVQTDIGDLLFYAMAEDFSGNTGTVPIDNPHINPLRIEVIDPIMPTLTHTPITTLEAGETVDIVSTADDNIGLDEINMCVKGVGESVFTEYPMSFNGDPKEYNATMPAQFTTGTLEYYVWCNDTSNNTVRLPASSNWSVDVMDTIAPQIIHSAINSVNVNDQINFTCQVSDVVGLDSVWLNFTDVHGVGYNVSMINAGSGNWYYLNATGQDLAGLMHYTIWANDTSDNLALFSHTTLVNDINTPLIFHDAPLYLDYNVSKYITLFVMDDTIITSVHFAYKNVSDSSFILINITSSDTDADDKYGNYTAEIPAQTILGTVEYYINATDGTNNISWPAIGPPHEIDVLDLEPPVISPDAYISIRSSPGDVTLIANVTDNHEVNEFVLHYLNSTSQSWINVSMVPVDVDASGSGTYQGIIPGHVQDIVKFYYSANDSSENSITSPESTPKLNPYSLIFLDYLTPDIEMFYPASTGVNSTTEIIINAIDDQEIASVQLYFNGTEDTEFWAITLSKLENGTYRGTLPPQDLSGDIQIYARASDGTNIHETQTFLIPVINQPPEIQHIGVESAPVGDNVAMVAQVYDDLHVDNVIFSWRPIGGSQYSNLTMVQTAFGVYQTDLSFQDAVIIQYHITAFDAENSTVWPDGPDHEISIMDLEAPIIIHEPLVQLNISSRPIITAVVSDNQQIFSVTLWYKNASASTFFSASMPSVSNLQDTYTAVLGPQPEGNFTYYIQATDGINTVETQHYTIEVIDSSGTNWTFIIIMIFLIILLVIAAIIVLMHLRGKPLKSLLRRKQKPIKEEDNPPEK